MKKIISFSIILHCLLLLFPILAHSESVSLKEYETVIQNLIYTARKVEKGKNLKPIQSLVQSKLIEWSRPGTCFTPYHVFQTSDLKGWYSHSAGNRDPILFLAIIFSNLPEAPIQQIKDISFDPYLPDACEGKKGAKKKKWYGRWLIYPGNFLLKEICSSRKIDSNPKIEKTLLYFSPNGENFYFVFRRENGRLILKWVAVDEDCVV